MEKTRIIKLSSLLVACALLVSAMVGVGVSADSTPEITETASIVSVNVEYREYLHLAFEVACDSVPEGAEVGIMVWSAGAKTYTSGNSLWESYELKDDGAGTDYYASQSIAAKNIGTEYQVAVVAKDADGVTLLSAPALYSIENWAETKLADPNTTDAARINLYNKVIAYGKAASGLFNK